MELLVLDSSFEAVAIVDSYESLIWTERYFECGDFEIYLPNKDGILDILELGFYLWAKDSAYMMIIEDIQLITSAEEGRKIVITGRSLESILDRRIVWNKTVLSGNLQNGIQTLLNENLINPSIVARKINGFIFEASTDPRITSLTYSEQFTRTNLYDTIQKICVSNNLGFWVFLNESNQLVFKLFMGLDRTYDQIENPYVVFSKKFDNLISSDYSFSIRNYKTATLIAGEGEDLDRKTTIVGGGEGLDRRELYTDAGDIAQTVDEVTLTDAQYKEQLIQRGISSLYEHRAKRAFDAIAETNLVFRYGEHFFMGDLVQMVGDDGVQSKVRVTELIRSKSAGGEETYPKFSMEDIEEYDTSSDLSPGTGGGGGGDYAPLVHTHNTSDITDFLNKVYPVGSIFMSVLSTSPATLFGGTWAAFAPGRVLIGFNSGETEFNASEKTGGAKTHTLTEAEMPNHNHTQNSHNHTQNAHNHTQNSHNHTQNAHNHTQNSHNHTQNAHNHTQNAHRHLTYKAWSFRIGTGTTNSATGVVADGFTSSLNYTDNTTPTNNEETAVNVAATATNNAETAVNVAATATNNATGGGGSHNNLQPYITVYMWKRTA